MLSDTSLSRSCCTLVERPAAFYCRMRSVGLLVRHGGSETSVLDCAVVLDLLGGTTAHLLQIKLPSWRAALAASLVSPEQNRWQTDSQQLHKRGVTKIAIVHLHLTQVQQLDVVLLKLSRWTACHRFSELAVMTAPPNTLMGGSTAAPLRSVDLCLAVRGIADKCPQRGVDIEVIIYQGQVVH